MKRTKIKVVVVGDSSVGKTTLVNEYIKVGIQVLINMSKFHILLFGNYDRVILRKNMRLRCSAMLNIAALQERGRVC